MSINFEVPFLDIAYGPDISKLKACISNTGNDNAIRSIEFSSKFEWRTT